MESVGLVISCILIIALLLYLIKQKKKNQLQKVFIINCSLILLWCILLLAQKYCCIKGSINPILFEYVIYICACFLPVSFLFTGMIFANTKITFKKKYLLLFIIPI